MQKHAPCGGPCPVLPLAQVQQANPSIHMCDGQGPLMEECRFLFEGHEHSIAASWLWNAMGSGAQVRGVQWSTPAALCLG
eukprot:4649325-Amphidinium_carterae.1